MHPKRMQNHNLKFILLEYYVCTVDQRSRPDVPLLFLCPRLRTSEAASDDEAPWKYQ